MTQKQVLKYTAQFEKFTNLAAKLHPDYIGLAWGIAHREGLQNAISFCETKIQDTQLMQAYRDEHADNN